jgi:hypothetical protein
MKLNANLALALVVTVLLAVGAVGFADKTQELAGQRAPSTLGEQHQMDDGSTMEGMDHEQPTEQPTEPPMEQPMEGMNH